MNTITAPGCYRWVIADGYIPAEGTHGDRRFVSHDAACILNAGDEAAAVSIMLYFSDRNPVGPYRVEVPSQRTLHLRFNELTYPQPVPRETDYSSVIESTQPVVVQHRRLDSRQSALALMTTLAYATD